MSTQVSETTAAATRTELPAIHLAAQRGDLDVLKRLVTAANVNDLAEDGSYALQWAASGNHWEATKFLLDNEADPNLKGPLDSTALHWTTRNGLVYMSRLLIEAGADLHARDSQLYTPLHAAVHSSNVLMVIYLLHLEQPADPNAIDASGRTPLHWAAYQGDHLSTKSLLRAGTNPNLQDNEGFIPLHWALVSREPNCINLLVEAKSNLSLENQDGKSCWVIAEEMNSQVEWRNALLADDRWPESGIPIPRRIKPAFAKWVLFLLPFILLPCFAHIIILGKFCIPIALVSALVLHKVCLKYLYPAVDRSQHAVLKSPALAGIYNAMVFWVCVVYFVRVLPATWKEHPYLNLVFLAVVVCVLVFYGATALLDPGTILPGSISERCRNINKLLDDGIYDGQHFCVQSWTLKPIRAHYNRIPNAVIARFDHYCPWTYNSIGIRNHRAFILYVLSLATAIWIYTKLYWDYICGLDENFWDAVHKDEFSAILYVGTFLQGAWITLLAFTQLLQIARGMTTAEFGHGQMTSQSFSSLPHDHPLASKAPPAPEPQPVAPRQHGSCFLTCLKVLGVHQALMTSKSVRRKRSSGLGIWTNCGDFWCTGFNVLRPDTHGRLNGQYVDYSTVLETSKNPKIAQSTSGAQNSLRSIV